jgi:hypothetical protein
VRILEPFSRTNISLVECNFGIFEINEEFLIQAFQPEIFWSNQNEKDEKELKITRNMSSPPE